MKFAPILLVSLTVISCVQPDGTTPPPKTTGSDLTNTQSSVTSSTTGTSTGTPTSTTTTTTTITPNSFSYLGEAALAALNQSHSADKTHTWNASVQASFDTGWFLQIPQESSWGQSVEDLEKYPTIEGLSEDEYDPDFLLPYCNSDADCDAGLCREVAATVTQVSDFPRSLCVGHSDYIWDEMYMVLASAEEYADVSSLDFPDNGSWNEHWVEEGRFLVAIRNALRYLDSTGHPIDVRFMFGWLIDDLLFDDMLSDRMQVITEGLSDDTSLNLYFGGINYDLLSWNHSKIIAADGETLLTGGINFYSTDYLYSAPVQDVSIRLTGQPAIDAHRYLDQIWIAFEVDWNNWTGDFDGVYTWLETVPNGLDAPSESPAWFVEDYPSQKAGMPILSLGRLGVIDRWGLYDPSPSDDAIMAAINATQESVKLSLQDLGSVMIDVVGYGWNERLFTTLSARALDDVTVEIVISQLGAGAYSYGWTTKDALEAFMDVIENDPPLRYAAVAADGSVKDFICNRIGLATVRVNDVDDFWAGDIPMGNHSKFFLLDERAFYIGSQNLYLSNLFEWGILIDNEELTHEAIDAYWDPLWRYSQRSAVSGPDALECELD